MSRSSRTSTSSATAPRPSSGLPGALTFLGITTSSGAFNALATSAATSTPPRGIPRTTTSSPAREARAAASRCPASLRSANNGSPPPWNIRSSRIVESVPLGPHRIGGLVALLLLGPLPLHLPALVGDDAFGWGHRLSDPAVSRQRIIGLRPRLPRACHPARRGEQEDGLPASDARGPRTIVAELSRSARSAS